MPQTSINILPREKIPAAPDSPCFSHTANQLSPAAAAARDLGKGLAGRLTTYTLYNAFFGPAFGVHFTLLADLAVVDAAKLKAIERDSVVMSSSDFWVYARLATDKKTLIHLNWAGYRNGKEEIEFAKPQAAVRIALEAIKPLDFQEHSLSEEDRAWASRKFSRDWKKMKDLDFHWWVRERYIITIGVIDDSSALPTLRELLEGDPKDRTVYYAINAITRLTKNDLRGNSVEEMDINQTRKKIVNSLREKMK